MAQIETAFSAGRRTACEHEDLEELGAGGRAVYYRCPACGAVFIEDGPKVWTLVPAA